MLCTALMDDDGDCPNAIVDGLDVLAEGQPAASEDRIDSVKAILEAGVSMALEHALLSAGRVSNFASGFDQCAC